MKVGLRVRLREALKRALRKRGILLERVGYRTEVPADPYEVQQLLIERLGIERPVVFDLGANRGDVSARYRELLPNAEIHCFEPFPDSCRQLRRRFERDAAVHVHELAVAEGQGRRRLHLTGYHQTHSLLRRESVARRYYPESVGAVGEAIEVETTTLDAFCSEQAIGRVDVVKMDIQGGEIRALRGAEGLLAAGDVAIVYTEAALIRHYEAEGLLHELTAELERYRLDLYDLYHLYRGRNGQLRYCEALFVSRELRQRAIDTFPPEP